MLKTILKQNIISLWIQWQFLEVPKNILTDWRNFLKFGINYFSLPLLLKTLFSHWHKYKMSYKKGFFPWQWFETFVFNMMSRGIGSILRISLIFIGFLVEIFIFFIGLLIFFSWLVLPILLLAGLFFGLRMLF